MTSTRIFLKEQLLTGKKSCMSCGREKYLLEKTIKKDKNLGINNSKKDLEDHIANTSDCQKGQNQKLSTKLKSSQCIF